MEKKNFVGLLLIMLILFLYPLYMTKLSPPPSSPREIKKTTQITSPFIPQPETLSFSETPLNAHDTVHDTVMENSRLWVRLSNQGASLKEIRLIRFKDTKGENGLTIYKSDSSDKNSFAWAGPVLGYDLNRVRFAYKEKQNQVSYALVLPAQAEIKKTFALEEDSDLIKVSLEIKNLQDKPLPLAFPLMIARSFLQNEPFAERYLEIAFFSQQKIQRDALRQKKKVKDYIGEINWLALKSHYFCQIITAQAKNISFSGQRLEDNNLEVIAHIPLGIIEPGQVREEKFVLYAGPLDTELLSRYNQEWANIVYYGIFDGIAKLILRVLKMGFLLFRNYGLAIILLSLLVNLCLFPFTWKGMKSMQRLQALQPQIERLRKEYNADPQRLNKEVLKLYRKNKANPLGGCLPMILQMPVFIALYQALSRAIQLKGATFLWIKDLSAPDALIRFAEKRFFVESLNLLPIIMALATYLQQKKSQMVAQPSHKQMTWLMPLLLGFAFYNLPSGLILYWVVSTFVSLGLQGLLGRRHDLPA